MLFAKGTIGVADTSVTVSVGIGSGTLILAVLRKNAVFDTRVVPASSSLRPAGGVLIVLLEGRVVWLVDGSNHAAPCVFVTPDDSSPAFAHYRTEGSVLRAVEIHVSGSIAEQPPRACSSEAIESAERYHRACLDDVIEGDRTARAEAMFEALRADGVPVALSAEDTAPASRMWQTLAAVVERFDLGSTMALVALGTGVSERQARRDLQTTLERLKLPYSGWRDAAKRFRLRLAIVLLSAPEASISQIARAVGYRHSEALANAFAEAGLPAPGRVRRALLAFYEGRDELAEMLETEGVRKS